VQTFPPDIRFCFPWRDYQARALEELDTHLNDEHLHLVAPPGAGKTVLGLEIMLRLNRKTLILAPSIAIREQWIHHFCTFFLQETALPVWISRDLRTPGFMTVSTYQALHQLMGRELDRESFLHSMQKTSKTLLILDEAHHLKRAWWTSLQQVKETVQPMVLGLTATPPYDASAAEWQRYQSLNGPIDTEISVPELVRSGDLCPHQDFVYFCQPSSSDQEAIKSVRDKIKDLLDEARIDITLLDAIQSLPMITHPAEHTEEILEAVDIYSSCLIYLHDMGQEIEYEQLAIIGAEKIRIPALDYSWLEVLLNFFIWSEFDHFRPFEEHQTLWRKKLKQAGVLDRKRIRLQHPASIYRKLQNNQAKLESIQAIAASEYQQLGKALRMVVLCDYIRPEYLTKRTLSIDRLGVVPVFKYLRSTHLPGIRLGVLTGSLIIVPLAALDDLQALSLELQLPELAHRPLAQDPHYVELTPTNEQRTQITALLTEAFQRGHLHILTGTQALLGEGWDAPAINTLVLASYIGSFVTSNQMRGRALRTFRKNAQKTANIWHLVCLEPGEATGGDDLQILQRRFQAFCGLSYDYPPAIVNNFNRLRLPPPEKLHPQFDHLNLQMLDRAADRSSLSFLWDKALQEGRDLREEVNIPFPPKKSYPKRQKLYYRRTVAASGAAIGSVAVGFLSILQPILGGLWNFAPQYLFPVVGGAGMLYFGPKALRFARLYLKHPDIANDLEQIGKALLGTLIGRGYLVDEERRLMVCCELDRQGHIHCQLEGATTYEQSVFLECLQQIIGPVQNPRYLIIRKSRLWKRFRQRDYHSVPDLLGRKKEDAQHFLSSWRKQVGPCELVFTRTPEGRKILLQARWKALAAQWEPRAQRAQRWK
jgi:superfamily II DNA or RNA helicase